MASVTWYFRNEASSNSQLRVAGLRFEEARSKVWVLYVPSIPVFLARCAALDYLPVLTSFSHWLSQLPVLDCNTQNCTAWCSIMKVIDKSFIGKLSQNINCGDFLPADRWQRVWHSSSGYSPHSGEHPKRGKWCFANNNHYLRCCIAFFTVFFRGQADSSPPPPPMLTFKSVPIIIVPNMSFSLRMKTNRLSWRTHVCSPQRTLMHIPVKPHPWPALTAVTAHTTDGIEPFRPQSQEQLGLLCWWAPLSVLQEKTGPGQQYTHSWFCAPAQHPEGDLCPDGVCCCKHVTYRPHGLNLQLLCLLMCILFSHS